MRFVYRFLISFLTERGGTGKICISLLLGAIILMASQGPISAIPASERIPFLEAWKEYVQEDGTEYAGAAFAVGTSHTEERRSYLEDVLLADEKALDILEGELEFQEMLE